MGDDGSHPLLQGAQSRIFAETKDPGILRQFSSSADASVSNIIGSKMGPALSVIFMLNSLTGLSLLTLPYGFSQAGLLLGAAILLGCMVLAFVTSTFMCEALTIANALQYEEAEKRTLSEYGQDLLDKLSDQHKRASQTSSFGSNGEPVLLCKADTVTDFIAETRVKNSESEFKIRERVELGPMGEMVLHSRRGKSVAHGIYLMVLSYTYGTASALVVTVNESLSHTVCTSMALATGEQDSCDEKAVYLGSVLVTFFVTLPLCFTNLQKTKKFTLVIMVLRFIAIAVMLLIGGIQAVNRVKQEGSGRVFQEVPLWRPENFMAVFANAVFLFGVHHYLPSMIAPLEPQRLAYKVIWTAFSICYVLIISVCSTALLAFGGEMDAVCSSKPGGHLCAIQPLYNLNFGPLSWGGGAVAIFLLAYPAMAIASIPIAAITTRNTMGRWLGLPASDPEKPYTRTNVLLTLAVLVPPFIVAALTTNVQAVIAYVGGYSGLTVAVLCPLILVTKTRKELNLERDGNAPRPLKSPFANRFGYALVIIFYCLALVLVTKKLFFTAPAAAAR